jgi:hypothetical protein
MNNSPDSRLLTGIGNSTMMPLPSKNDVSDENENENEKGTSCSEVAEGALVDRALTDMSGGDVTTDVEAEQPDSNEVLDGVVGDVGGGISSDGCAADDVTTNDELEQELKRARVD